MLIEFQQGIYRQQDTRPFLTLGNKGVDINVDDSPTIITFLHGNSNYLFTEDNNIPNAWIGPFPRKSTAWLYWDINLTTGKRTFGYTVVDPFENRGFGSALPVSPKRGQHFFLTTENKMKYYTGKSWRTVVRVFAGVVKDNAQLEIFKNGSQIGKNIQSYAGHIIFNENNIPVKKSGKFSSSEFVTTETEFKFQNDLGNTYKIENTQINARAIEPVPKYHCVNFKGPKKYGLASRLDPDRPCVGVAVEDFVKDRIGKIVTHGVLQNPDFWNFSEPYGTTIWVGDTGEITTVVPQSVSMQNIGYVINPTTVFIDIRHVIKMIRVDDDCVLPSPTPTATPTMTPSSTVTPTTTVQPSVTATVTATVTPSSTLTPTATLTPTPTVTPTMTITPTMTVTPTLTVTPTPSSSPSIVFVPTYHEWKMSEDIGSIVYDTGTALNKVDGPEIYTTSVEPLKNVKTFVQDDINASASSYIITDWKEVTLNEPIPSDGPEWGYSLWINPKRQALEDYSVEVLNGIIQYNSIYQSIMYNYTYETRAYTVPFNEWTHIFVSVEHPPFPATPSSISIASGGTGYQVGDVVTITDNAITPSSLVVNYVGVDGEISFGFGIQDYGVFSQAPATNTVAIIGGSGTGATATINFDKIAKIYINGQLSYESISFTRNSQNMIGMSDSGYEWDARMCHVRFYNNHTLSSTEVLDLYNTYTVVERPSDYFGTKKIFPEYPIRRTGNRFNAIQLYSEPIQYMYLSPDDSIMIFGSRSDGILYRADMSTPDDINTAHWASNVITANYINPDRAMNTSASGYNGIFRYGYGFSEDGYKLYYTEILEFSDTATLVEMALSTPWDINTASPTNNTSRFTDALISSSIRGPLPGEMTPVKPKFNPDGTKMFALDIDNLRIIQYTCGTPYDITTLQYEKMSNALSGASFDVTSFWFAPNGSKYWVMSNSGSTIQEYICLTNWDVGGSFFDADILPISAIPSANDLNSIQFSSDGTYLYAGDYDLDDIHQYQCITPYEIKGATYLGKIDITTYVDGFKIKPDGTKLYVLSGNNDSVNQWSMSTPWDITTATDDGVSFSVINEISSGQLELDFGDNGTKLYVCNYQSIWQYTLSIAWDITSATYDNKFARVSLWESSMTSFKLDPTGLKVYIVGRSSDQMREFRLASAWDISTLYTDNAYTNLGDSSYYGLEGLDFNSTGTSAFVHVDNEGVVEYDLSTPYDLTTASLKSQSFTAYQQISSSFNGGLGYKGLFSADGTSVYSIYNGRYVVQWACSSPYDIKESGMSVTHMFDIGAVSSSTNTERIWFKPDGTGFYCADDVLDSVLSFTLSTPWDLSTTSYTAVLSVTPEGLTTPRDLFFKSDGTIMYVYNGGTRTVFQYTLGVAWDITSATYASKSKLLNTELSVHLKEDGTKLYGLDNNRIRQYTLSIPWDISTATLDVGVEMSLTNLYTSNLTGVFFDAAGNYALISYSTNSTYSYYYRFDMSVPFDITTGTYKAYKADIGVLSAQTIGDFSGLHFKPDGTSFYIANWDINYIYQFDMSAPWDVDTATYTKRKLVSAQDGTPYGPSFNDDGTKMYVMGGSNDTLYEYTLGTAWDVTTAVYGGVSLSTTLTDTSITIGVSFTPDGTKLFLVGLTSKVIYRYTLSVAWDISTATKDSMIYDYFPDLGFNGRMGRPSPDGTKFYLGGDTSIILQYEFGTPYDLTTLSLGAERFNLLPYDTESMCLDYSPDGLNFFMAGQGGSVYQFRTPVAWKLSTLTFTSSSSNVSATAGLNSVGFSIPPSGDVLYVGNSDGSIHKYNISPAWDILGITHDSSGTAQGRIFTDFCDVSPDGTKLYAMYDDILVGEWINNREGMLLQGDMSTPYDVTTASLVPGYYKITQDTSVRSIKFNTDGTRLFVLGGTNDTLYQYNLSTGWDLRTITYDTSQSLAAQSAAPGGIFFKPDGTKMYYGGGDFVFQYTLGTPWDIATLSYDSVFFSAIASGEFDTTDISIVAFSPTGDKMYITKGSNATHNYWGYMYNYTLGTPWDISTSTIIGTELTNHYYGLLAEWNSAGTKLYGPFESEGYQIWDFNVLTPWDLTVYQSARGETDWVDGDETSISPDGGSYLINGQYNSYSMLRVMRRDVLGDWTTYWQEIDPVNAMNEVLISNNGQYLFVVERTGNNLSPTDDIIHVFEDQLNGTYSEISTFNTPYFTDIFNISDDGSVVLIDKRVYRQSGSVWSFEFELDVPENISFYASESASRAYIVPDGSRIIMTQGYYNTFDVIEIQSPIVWKYTGSTWVREGIIDLTHPDLLNTVIYDGYSNYKTQASVYFGQDPYNGTNFIGASDDGSTIALNYEIKQTIRDESYNYSGTGVVVFKETSPGVWEFVQRLRLSHPTTTIDTDESWATFVAMSRDGNRIAASQISDNFSQVGAHGRIDIWDWSAVDGEYKFIKYIEPTDADPSNSDLFGSFLYIPGDGRYVFTSGYGYMEDGLERYGQAYNIDIHMMFEIDCGVVGAQPEYEYYAPRYKNWVTDTSLPYKDPIYTTSPYHHWYTDNSFDGLKKQSVITSVERDSAPPKRYSSHMGYNSGKYYVEFYFNRDTTQFDNIIVNGGFDTDTDWNKGVGWTIYNGVASSDGTQVAVSLLTSTISTSSDIRFYELRYTITSLTSGSITPKLPSGTGVTRTSPGSYVELIESTVGNFSIEASSDFIGSVDNISLTEVTGFRVGVAYRDYTLPYGLLVNNATDYYGLSEYHYMYDARGALYNNGVSTPFTKTGSTGVIGMAVDIDNMGVWFSVNGVWLQGDPETNTDPVFNLGTVPPGQADYLYVCTGEYTGGGTGERQTRTIFRTNVAEFKYAPPTGFTGWDTTVSSRLYDFPSLVELESPAHWWRMDSNNVISDQISSNDLVITGISSSPPTHSEYYGFKDVGSIGAFAQGLDIAAIELTTPIVKAVSQPFTLSAMLYLVPNPDDPGQFHQIFSSIYNDGFDEFELYAVGDGTGEGVTFRMSSYHVASGVYRSYSPSSSPSIKVGMRYNRWFQLTLMSEGDGVIQLFIDGVDADVSKYVQGSTYTSFVFANPGGVPTADFRINYIGPNPEYDLHGYITEVLFFDEALAEKYDRSFSYTTTFINIPQCWRIISLAQLCAWNHNDSAVPQNAFPYSWPGPYATWESATAMLYHTPGTTSIVSDYDTITLTEYSSVIDPLLIISEYETVSIQEHDSFVGPNSVLDTFGPYTFTTSTAANTYFFFYSPTSSTLSTTGSTRRWCFDTNDTPSTGVGPTSGQGGSPEGYVYTEGNSTVINDIFRMQYKTSIDASPYTYMDVQFYTNQRGTSNNATCHLEVNEDGSGWVQVGPTFGGASDPDKVATSGVQIWSHRTIELYGFTGTIQLRWVVTMPSVNVNMFHNDYGLDTITITGYGLR